MQAGSHEECPWLLDWPFQLEQPLDGRGVAEVLVIKVRSRPHMVSTSGLPAMHQVAGDPEPSRHRTCQLAARL